MDFADMSAPDACDDDKTWHCPIYKLYHRNQRMQMALSHGTA